MKNIELLAPAGDYDSFLAAVENGANAVYLGGKILNARQLAGNFDSRELSRALKYAHVRDVNIYLAMNTLISDSEMQIALDFIKEAYLMGIDGIIVQDLGFASLVRGMFLDLHLHASTQMTTYNLEGVRLLEKLGFKRVVLARELSLGEIQYICKNTQLEIETFIHGALCICYSGQCLMSSIIGGRSGNRGKCAQPCRLPYSLVEENTVSKDNIHNPRYIMSPKDQSTVQFIGEIANSGVKSLKIEGRMKNPEYVATVVRIYRNYLDRIQDSDKTGVEKKDLKQLAQIFNRGGFSKGYYFGKSGMDMMCPEKPKNWGIYLGKVLGYDSGRSMVTLKLEEQLSIGDGVEIWTEENESPGSVVSWIGTGGKKIDHAEPGMVVGIERISGNIRKGDSAYKTSDKKLNTEARESFSGRYRRKVKVKCSFKLEQGRPALLKVSDSRNDHVEAWGTVLPEKALNKPLSSERLSEQLGKTGATPFEISSFEINIDDDISLPISEINELRRKALEELEHRRENKYQRVIRPDEASNRYSCLNQELKNKPPLISAYFMNPVEGLDYSAVKADRIYLPFAYFTGAGRNELEEICRRKMGEVFLWLPSITKGNYDKLIKSRVNIPSESGADGILAANTGSLEYFLGRENIKLVCDYSFNIFNSDSLGELCALGLSGAVLSPELNLEQIRNIKSYKSFEKEIITYGRIPLMTSEYCPAGSIQGGFTNGKTCNKPCQKKMFKLKDRKGMEFPVVCDRIDCRSTILNANLLFIADSFKDIKEWGVDYIRLNISDEKTEEIYDLAALHRYALENGGKLPDKYKNLIDKIKSFGFTKGHYFRGV
ncbi:MAG: DUF3656 domain-containing protein [Bacillota bacterium]|nr:DUF3656 domain-containing protein [Bacillota bacterium]